jgi:hypothetical protein
MNVWLVGRYLNDYNDEIEYMGVFSSREKAVAACKRPSDWIGPFELDEVLPDELAEEWPGLELPLWDPPMIAGRRDEWIPAGDVADATTES